MEGSTGLRSGRQLKLNYGPSLERLAAGDRVGVKRTAEGAMKIRRLCGRAVQRRGGGGPGDGEPGGWGDGRVCDLIAQSDEPRARPGEEPGQPPGGQPPQYRAREGSGAGQQPEDTVAATVFELHDNTGRNVALCHGNTVARRHDSYNQGLVMSARC